MRLIDKEAAKSIVNKCTYVQDWQVKIIQL